MPTTFLQYEVKCDVVYSERSLVTDTIRSREIYMELAMTRLWFTIVYRWFSPDVTAAMLVYRTIEEKVFWEFDSIIMQNMCHNLLLFCTQTWPSHHVIENHLLSI